MHQFPFLTFRCHSGLSSILGNPCSQPCTYRATFGLRRSIRRLLTTESTATLVPAFILSRIDYCNSLLYGCPRSLVLRLQKLQKIINLHCAVMHMKEENRFFKKVHKHKIQDGGMFTWKFKMAAIFFVKLYTSLPIHRCIDHSNRQRCEFIKVCVIPRGLRPTQIPAGGYFDTLPIEVGGTKAQLAPLG